jgi:hypothetical protein
MRMVGGDSDAGRTARQLHHLEDQLDVDRELIVELAAQGVLDRASISSLPKQRVIDRAALEAQGANGRSEIHGLQTGLFRRAGSARPWVS